MKKILLALVMSVFALGVMGQAAEAAKKKTAVVVTPWWGWGWNGTTWVWNGPWTVRDPKLAASNFWVGAGSTAAYFAIRGGGSNIVSYRGVNYGVSNSTHSSGFAYGASALGCAAVSPIIGTLVVNRPLTTREVFVSTGNCALPFVGGWVMNAWFDRNGWK
ncbi:MAG: hypothetical protein ABUL48_02790 [Pseudorhodoplanes sp.]